MSTQLRTTHSQNQFDIKAGGGSDGWGCNPYLNNGTVREPNRPKMTFCALGQKFVKKAKKRGPKHGYRKPSGGWSGRTPLGVWTPPSAGGGDPLLYPIHTPHSIHQTLAKSQRAQCTEAQTHAQTFAHVHTHTRTHTTHTHICARAHLWTLSCRRAAIKRMAVPRGPQWGGTLLQVLLFKLGQQLVLLKRHQQLQADLVGGGKECGLGTDPR